jgi:hypothetical protein
LFKNVGTDSVSEVTRRNTEELVQVVRSAFTPAYCEVQVAKDDTDDPILLVRIVDESGNEAARDEIYHGA